MKASLGISEQTQEPDRDGFCYEKEMNLNNYKRRKEKKERERVTNISLWNDREWIKG